MIFNSLEFAVFLPVVFMLYWYVTNSNLKAQNILLLVASYVFYGWWDWRFLILLFSLSLTNYLIGIKIGTNEAPRKVKLWLIAGLIANVGILGYFKYYNFFVDSFIDLISVFGYELPASTTKIILPLGISFYVFLSISYLIDIYKNNLQVQRNMVDVLLTLSFFPIILAGPIQRPRTLLPQITRRREFSYGQAADGLRQILWGLFAKVVIADNLGNNVDNCFLNYSGYSGSTLYYGALLYSVQIYADFSGYSNMAIGIGKLFGFNLMQNFAYPYFSRDITEFWKRWHMSLTSWFRDYLFLPLSFAFSWRVRGERVLLIKTDHFLYITASIITWLLTGLWHGANYTFIAWGIINGVLLIIYHLQAKPRKRLFKRLKISNNNIIIAGIETFITINAVIIAWIVFRSDSIYNALEYLKGMFSSSLFSISHGELRSLTQGREIIYESILAVTFLVSEWVQRGKEHALQFNDGQTYLIFRWTVYNFIMLSILFFQGDQQVFIYFQF
jgi:D-alanyl-lipoteichoic acid acyltransferase DltB (MBOAT superfamily)